MRKRRKIKKIVIIIPMVIILIIIGIIVGKNYYKKINSYDYKLSKLGYTQEEIKIIDKLKINQVDTILNQKYNRIIPKFIKQKYFIFDNLDRYLKYYIEHKTENKKDIVALVNVNADYDYYTHTTKTDTSKGILMLVNKYNYLTKEYTMDDLENVSILYKYGEQQLKKETYDAFKSMYNAAKEENLTLIVNSSYRTYQYQEDLWNNYATNKSEEYADNYAARAGFSEHQTGLAMDLITYGATGTTFKDTDEYKWLIKNAYKYGFILRYPEGKEKITGYAYESWHYRYVGKNVALKIHNEDITYDEYYAYYLK